MIINSLRQTAYVQPQSKKAENQTQYVSRNQNQFVPRMNNKLEADSISFKTRMLPKGITKMEQITDPPVVTPLWPYIKRIWIAELKNDPQEIDAAYKAYEKYLSRFQKAEHIISPDAVQNHLNLDWL